MLWTEIAVLVDDSLAHSEPTEEQLATWTSQRNVEAREQMVQKEEELKGSSIRIVGGKRKSDTSDAATKRAEREARRAQSQNAQSDILNSPDQNIPVVSGTIISTMAPASQPFSINVPASSLALPAYTPEPHVYSTIDSARDAGIWSYPSTQEQRGQCAVFRALWDKGYYMGPGIKFGGQWLVYPGDPLRYHSHFVATVHVGSVKPMEIVAHGRLGTATRKSHLLCGWDEASGEVSIFSVEWASFG